MAIVSAESTALRDTPSAQGTVIQTLPQETLLSLQGQASGAWVRVQVANGVLPGWVYGPDLKRIDDAAAIAAATPVARPAVTNQPIAAGASAGGAVPTARAANAQPTPQVVALASSPIAPPPQAQRTSLAVSVLLVNSASTATATPRSVGAGTPTPRANGMPPLAGLRVQLVDAFGDVLAEAITPESGAVTLRRELAPGTAVFLRVPAPGLQIPIDITQLTVSLTVAIPVGG
jgi:hypothetical protein